MVCAHLYEDERVAKVLEGEVELLGVGLVGVREVHEGEAAQADGGLVHEAAGLAVVGVLGALAHLGEGHGPGCLSAPERLHGASEQRLDGCRARQAAARGDVAAHREIKAARTDAGRGCDLVGHAAHETCGGAALVFARVGAHEVELEGGVALRGHAHERVGARAGDGVRGDVERAGDDAAALVVGVVAGDL